MTSLSEEIRPARRLPPASVARLLRRQAGVPQQRPATELGVHRVMIVRWEIGSRTPRAALRAACINLLATIQAALSATATDRSWRKDVR
jgi:DNA-binding transcriptional regulator YiaG